MKTKIHKIDSCLFTRYSWFGGSVTSMFGFPHRYEQLVENRDKLVLYSIGYCLGEELSFRQKPGHFAVLFEYDGTEWWNHFTEKEFVQIFC